MFTSLFEPKPLPLERVQWETSTDENANNISYHADLRSAYVKGDCRKALSKGRIPTVVDIEQTSRTNYATVYNLTRRVFYQRNNAVNSEITFRGVGAGTEMFVHDPDSPEEEPYVFGVTEVTTAYFLAYKQNAEDKEEGLPNLFILPVFTLYGAESKEPGKIRREHALELSVSQMDSIRNAIETAITQEKDLATSPAHT